MLLAMSSPADNSNNKDDNGWDYSQPSLFTMRQVRQWRPCGKEGSGGRAARKTAVAARQGRQQRPRGKEGSGGVAMKVAAAQQGRQRQRNNGSANQKMQVRSGGYAYQHAPEGVAGEALP
jgi:hypothetical protein